MIKTSLTFTLLFIFFRVFSQNYALDTIKSTINVSDAKFHIGEYKRVYGVFSEKLLVKNKANPSRSHLFVYMLDSKKPKSKFLIIFKINLKTSDTAFAKSFGIQYFNTKAENVKPIQEPFAVPGKIILFNKQPAIMMTPNDFPIEEKISG